MGFWSELGPTLLALITENPEFVGWREAWRDRPRQWWRIILVLVAFFGELVAMALPTSLLLIPWLAM